MLGIQKGECIALYITAVTSREGREVITINRDEANEREAQGFKQVHRPSTYCCLKAQKDLLEEMMF